MLPLESSIVVLVTATPLGVKFVGVKFGAKFVPITLLVRHVGRQLPRLLPGGDAMDKPGLCMTERVTHQRFI